MKSTENGEFIRCRWIVRSSKCGVLSWSHNLELGTPQFALRTSLQLSQRVDDLEPRGPPGREESTHEPHRKRERDSGRDQLRRHTKVEQDLGEGPEIHR